MIPTVFQDQDKRRLSRNVDSRFGGNRICRRLPNTPWEGSDINGRWPATSGGNIMTSIRGQQRLVGT